MLSIKFRKILLFIANFGNVFPIYFIIPAGIKLIITLSDFSDNMARITYRQHIFRNVTSDNAACADHGVFADMYARQNNRAFILVALSRLGKFYIYMEYIIEKPFAVT